MQVGFPDGNDRYDHDDYIADNDDDDDDGDDDEDNDDDEDDDVPTIIGITAFRWGAAVDSICCNIVHKPRGSRVSVTFSDMKHFSYLNLSNL